MSPPKRWRGFTLLELLIVLVIIALGTVGVTMAIPDPAESALEREAVRLTALFESARAQSRASGVPVTWATTADGFLFAGVPKGVLPERWANPSIRAESARPITLGPEPILEPQFVELRHSESPSARRRIATDGLRPFRISDSPE